MVDLDSDGLALLFGQVADLQIKDHLRQRIVLDVQQFAQSLMGFAFGCGAPHGIHYLPATLGREEDQFKNRQTLAGTHRLIVP